MNKSHKFSENEVALLIGMFNDLLKKEGLYELFLEENIWGRQITGFHKHFKSLLNNSREFNLLIIHYKSNEKIWKTFLEKWDKVLKMYLAVKN